MQVLTSVISENVKKISDVCIARDHLDSTSGGICYVESETIIDALALYVALISLYPPLNIDGKTVIISYSKYNMDMGEEQPITPDLQNATQPSTNTDADSLAKSSAKVQAENEFEYMQYYEYYKSYFAEQITAGNVITPPQDNQSSNSEAEAAQSVVQQMSTNNNVYDTECITIASDTEEKTHVADYLLPTTSYDYSEDQHFKKPIKFKPKRQDKITKTQRNLKKSTHILNKKLELFHRSNTISPEAPAPSTSLVATYLDFRKLICYLCNRRLKSKKALAKHAKFSIVHKQNLKLKKANAKKDKKGRKAKIFQPDRTKKRGEMYEDMEELTSSTYKPMESDGMLVTSTVPKSISSENITKHCYESRMKNEEGDSGSNESCNYVTKTIMLRNLDASITEVSVMQILTSVIPEVAIKVYAVYVVRDLQASTSGSICYLETGSILDALVLYDALTNLSPPLNIEGNTVITSFSKHNIDKVQEQSIGVDLLNATKPCRNTDVDSLARSSAKLIAENEFEYMQYYEYYKSYFMEQSTAGNSISPPHDNQVSNFEQEVAQSAIQQISTKENIYDTKHISLPSSTDCKTYPDLLEPETSYASSVVQQSNKPFRKHKSKHFKQKKQEKIKVSKKNLKYLKKWAIILNRNMKSAVNDAISPEEPTPSTSSVTEPTGSENVDNSLPKKMREIEDQDSDNDNQ
ncbi:hypothetical protein FQR65_LT17159 [Abscondita terminalis]|nr:hypothetical protein FQR65_LT17159 [Abscondita terminalis]